MQQHFPIEDYASISEKPQSFILPEEDKDTWLERQLSFLDRQQQHLNHQQAILDAQQRHLIEKQLSLEAQQAILEQDRVDLDRLQGEIFRQRFDLEKQRLLLEKQPGLSPQ